MLNIKTNPLIGTNADESALDTSKTISDSPITIQWVLDSLKSSDHKFQGLTETSKVTNVTGVDISHGKGFISKVYKVSIKFEDQDKAYEVCLKVPGVESINEVLDRGEFKFNEENRMMDKHAALCHNRECDFYENFAPHLDVILPKIYKIQKWIMGEQQGVILMESFFGRADNCPLEAGVTPEQMFSMAKQMASLHAYSLSIPPDQWIGKYNANMFESLSKGDFFESGFEQLRKQYPGVFDHVLDGFKRYRAQKKFYMYCMCDVGKDMGLPLVLNHGDLWTNNVLWKTNAGGSVSNELAAIIDWQIIHEGCMTYDLARFMVICADADVRKEYQFRMIELYHDELVNNLKKSGREVDVTKEQLTKTYKVNLIMQALIAMWMGPMFFYSVDPEAPDYEFKKAQKQKVLIRAKLAGEEALEYLKEIPDEKLIGD